MTKLGTGSRIAMVLSLLLVCSCIRAPLELTMKEKIQITKEQIADISEKVYDALKAIDFSEPIACPKPDAEAAYKIWLRKQFDRGRVPKGNISPEIYGESGLSANPNIASCRHIDFAKEYENATKDSAKKSKREAIVFRMGEIRDKLKSTKCTDNFIDPDQAKITIDEINLRVLENTLSVAAPTYKLYTSDDELSKEEMEENHAEENLLKDGIIYFLAKTKPIPPRFTGTLPADLESDRKKFSDAEVPIVGLDGSVVALPSLVASEPEVKKAADGTEYFVVPSGHLTLMISMKISIKLTMADSKCMYDQFKESIKKEEEERRALGQP